MFKNLIQDIAQVPEIRYFAKVSAVRGLMIEIEGAKGALSVGDHAYIDSRLQETIACEIVAFQGDRILAMPFKHLEGIGPGCTAHFADFLMIAAIYGGNTVTVGGGD